MRRALLPALLIALFLGLPSLPAGAAGAAPLQTVTFLDVGQGDAALLHDGAGFTVLVDGGPPEAGPAVLAFLRRHNLTQLDVMLATHAHADHIGGLTAVLLAGDIAVDQVLYNGYPGSAPTWTAFVEAVTADGLALQPASFPHVFTWGGMQAHVLHPPTGLIDPDPNDASLVLRLDYGQTTYLLTGDIGADVEAEIVARATPVASEVLKVAHHGSAYSTSDAFLAAVDPLLAVISVGDNDYGHPSPEALARLAASGASILRTDQAGDVLITSDGVAFTVGPWVFQAPLYLPLVLRDASSAPPPTVSTGDVHITHIFYDGILGTQEPDEYVEIRSQDTRPIQIHGWTLSDSGSVHVYTFPPFQIAPGQSCRVYTNQSHLEHCGFSFGSGTAVWNNGGDTASLYDAGGVLVDQYAY